jgi:hypothetical protein
VIEYIAEGLVLQEKEVEMRMFKIKMIVFVLLALASMASFAYCQEKTETLQTITTVGRVTKIDALNSVIEVETDDGQIAFTVSKDANITEGTKKIGLMEIGVSNSVTIQYYRPSPGVYVAVSVTYNKN